jgi:4-hydroxyphenylpyruvate dioxygenase
MVAEVLSKASRGNGGAVVDAAHFFRGGAQLEELDCLRGYPILAVQLSDQMVVSVDSPVARSERLLPGEGNTNIVGFLQHIEGLGFLGPYCIEVSNPTLHRRNPEDVAQDAVAKSVDLLRRAGVAR